MNDPMKCFIGVSALVLGLMLQPTAAHAASYSSKALIENAKLLDGKKVTYRGEAVTAIMKRGDHAWINVNDGDNAIGIWCKALMLEPVKFLGDYKNNGDILEIEGIFNRACSVHGGELDIHANKVKVLKAGSSRGEKVDPGKTALAIFFFLLTIAVTVVFRKRI
jgi:hypothetical protein